MNSCRKTVNDTKNFQSNEIKKSKPLIPLKLNLGSGT